ncbi:hypothetical protein Tco_1225613 [Tanacetum coccineum]
MQAIQTFLTDKANLGSPTKKGRKDKAHVIPYCQLTKLIICHLGRTNDIHLRLTSLFHLAEDDLRLGNLKFVPKGEDDKEGNKKSASTKQPIPKPAIEKTSNPAPAPKPKVTKEKPSNTTTAKPPKPKPAKEKLTNPTPLQKADKDEPGIISGTKSSACWRCALHTPKRRKTTDQFILQRRAPTIEEASIGPTALPLDDTSTNIVCDSPTSVDAEISAKSDKTNSRGDTKVLLITKELGEDVEKQETIKENTVELDEDQAGSDPGETHES